MYLDQIKITKQPTCFIEREFGMEERKLLNEKAEQICGILLNGTLTFDEISHILTYIENSVRNSLKNSKLLR